MKETLKRKENLLRVQTSRKILPELLTQMVVKKRETTQTTSIKHFRVVLPKIMKI
jgi:hypothetical protein